MLLFQLEITHNDMWIRTYGRLYQKLCSTSCEIPIGIYRTQDTSEESMDGTGGRSHSEVSTPSGGPDDSAGSTRNNTTTGPPSGKLSCSGSVTGTGFLPQINIHKSSCLGGCDTQRSSYVSVAVHDDGNNMKDTHVQLIERAEIASLIRSRMQCLGLPNFGDTIFHFSERRSSLSYVILNPSCDLKLKEGDIVYLIKPSPFSAQKTFERHNSRRKSTLSCVSGNGNAAGEGTLPGFNLFTQPGSDFSMRRRRSSSGSMLNVIPPVVMNPAPPSSPRVPVTKSNSLSLPESPTA